MLNHDKPKIPRPKSKAVIYFTLGLMGLALMLLFDIPYRAYSPLKWMLSMGLVWCAGFYLLPRRRILIEHPDKRSSNLGDGWRQRREDVAREAGWVEFDWIDGSVVGRRDREPVAIADERLQSISRATEKLLPISRNIAAIHLLLAIFFCPLVGINMSRDNWVLMDIFLACYLLFTLVIVVKESGTPRCTLVWLNCDGSPNYAFNHWQLSLRENGLRLWAMIAILALVVSAISLNDTKVFHHPDVPILKLAFGSAMTIFISGFIAAVLLGLVGAIWMCEPPTEIYVAIGVTIFFVSLNTQKFQHFIDPPPDNRPTHEDVDVSDEDVDVFDNLSAP